MTILTEQKVYIRHDKDALINEFSDFIDLLADCIFLGLLLSLGSFKFI